MENFIKLVVELPDDITDSVSDLLIGIGAESVSEDIKGKGYIEINAYFPADIDKESIENICSDFVKKTFGNKKPNLFLKWAYVNKESWSNWKKHLKTVVASKRVVIIPPWEKYKLKNNQHLVEINPSLAFGTGHHETTKICIAYLDEILSKTKVNSLFDVGCGSGVLAIAAIKLGAESAICIDNDFKAVRETKLNSKKNKVDKKISCINGLINSVNTKFDLIVSNIYAEILINSKESFKEKLHENSYLILSGITKEKKAIVIKEFVNTGFSFKGEKNDGGWTGLLFSKTKS